MTGPISKGAPRLALLGSLALSTLLAGCAVRVAAPPELPPEALEPDRWAAGPTDEPSGPIPVGIPAQILERRPDIVAAERQVTSAFHEIQVAQAARCPASA